MVVGSPKSDLRRRLSTAVLLPLGILAIVGALMAMQVEQQAEDAAWLDRTDEILGKSSDVLGEIVDQETGLRGYLASGDELFLEPYRKANPGPLIDELRASVSGDPAQVARVDEIRRRYEFWKDSTGRTTNDLSEARKPAALREGKREMDDIRTTIREFRSAEFELRRHRKEASVASSRVTRVTVVALAVFAAAMLAFFSRRQLAAVASAYDELIARESGARGALAATLRFQETFVATLGHDLKSPLNSIAMATQLLSRGLREKEQVDLATRILAATRRMTVMIDQLYDLSRSRLGDGIPVEMHPVDLSLTVRRAIEEHRITSPSPIELREKGQGIVCCDEPRIMQVISNLLGNALKHGMAGAPVTVTLNNDEPDVSISVHNAGSIPSGVQDHLFDPFISYGDRRHLREGLGLGLYIVDQIVRAHGGQVHVRSNEKDGTTFMIRVPRGGASSAPGG